MKKLILLISLAFSFTASAQVVNESQVPESIRNSVRTQYPNIKVQEWRKAGQRYEADYVVNEIGATLIFDQGGTFLESEKRIGFQEIPHSIQQYVASSMPGKKISQASRIVTGTGDMSYEMIIDGKEYYFDPQGKPLASRNTHGHEGHSH